MINYIRILRPLNLAIIACTQYTIFYLLLAPQFLKLNHVVLLGDGLIHLFVLATLIITAAGFVINDVFDFEADLLNKPNKTFIDYHKISFKNAKIYYVFLVSLGFLISIYIGWKIDHLLLIIIYPITVIMLYLYSSHLKKLPLLGNLLVALFSAFVPGIIFISEYEGISKLTQPDSNFIEFVVYAYLSFSFLISMYRELIKDIEDMEGDLKMDYITFPILCNVPSSKVYAQTILLFLLASYYYWIMLFRVHPFTTSYLVLFSAIIIVPTFYLYYKTKNSYTKSDFSKLSKIAKYIMLASIFIFISLTISYL